MTGWRVKPDPPYAFLAGIIQGSHPDDAVHDQGYRVRIRRILETRYPELTVYCPVENHPDSVNYDDGKAEDVFRFHLDLVKKASMLLVYLPQASMGSAVEMWIASQNRIPIIVISPMATNWVVRILADRLFASIDLFEHGVNSGGLDDYFTTTGGFRTHE